MKRQSFSSLSYSFVEWANFQKLLNQDPKAFIEVSRASILTVLWNSETGCATATDIALETDQLTIR